MVLFQKYDKENNQDLNSKHKILNIIHGLFWQVDTWVDFQMSY